MKIIRAFYPVGQGAFYCEDNNGRVIVYDCGSQNRNLIEEQARAFAEQNQKIEAVFISHLHMDHVNGLPALLQNCQVERVFLPLLNEVEKANCYLTAIIGESTGDDNSLLLFMEDLIFDGILRSQDGNVIERTRVIFVPPVNGEHPYSSLTDINNADQNATTIDKLSGILKTSKIFLGDNYNWFFMLYNFAYKERSRLLKAKFDNAGIPLERKALKSFVRFPDNLDRIKQIYHTLPGSLNCNSMTLYSGPALSPSDISSFRLMYVLEKHKQYLCPKSAAACLYFGDFEAKNKNYWQQFKKFYSHYWENVAIVQVPHHGSSRSYNREINNPKPKLSLISAGTGNRYRHPNPKTLHQIAEDGGFTEIITDIATSKLSIEIADCENSNDFALLLAASQL